MYVYLTDRVTELKGFSVEQYGDGREFYTVKSLHERLVVEQRNGRWRCFLGDSIKKVPPVLAEVVDEISFMEKIPASPHRETGVYRDKSARAEVTLFSTQSQFFIQIHIIGKKVEDIGELFNKIRVGSIRPEESYEGEQSGMSRADLEAGYERQSELFRLSMTSLRKEEERFRVLAVAIAHSLYFGPSWWPWCSRQKVVNEISKILRIYGTE